MAKINIGKDNPHGITKGIAAAIAVFAIFFLYCLIANKKEIIPVGLFVAGVWTIYRGYLASKSGSIKTDTEGVHYGDNIPIHKTVQFWIGLVLIFFSIVATIMQISER